MAPKDGWNRTVGLLLNNAPNISYKVEPQGSCKSSMGYVWPGAQFMLATISLTLLCHCLSFLFFC